MKEVDQLDTLNDATFIEFLKLIHERTGITIAKNRKSMVQGRLRKRAVELKLGDYETYLQVVKTDISERPFFEDAVTTNETYFYRTPRIWSHIVDVFLPSWFALHKNETFTAWSAAASSGEEAHTLAVLLQQFKDQNPGFVYQVLGTDISREMVGFCEKGLYSGRSIESFKKAKPELFSKYMETTDGTHYKIKPEIKSRLKFQQHNLFKPFTGRSSFDLILVRNVLIYFTAEDQEKVLALLEPNLKTDGLLVIGESESLTHIKTPFKSEQPLVYRKFSYLNSKKEAA